MTENKRAMIRKRKIWSKAEDCPPSSILKDPMIRVMAQLDMEGVYMRMLRMCERASCTTKVGVQIFEFKIQQTQINSF